jgi:hypothetical protein
MAAGHFSDIASSPAGKKRGFCLLRPRVVRPRGAPGLLATATDAAPFAALALFVESCTSLQRLAGMFFRMMLHIPLVGVITRSSPYPAPNCLNTHELVSRLTWYGASELPATGIPRK